MICNNCSNFSKGKLRVKIKSGNKKAYYFIWLLKCIELNNTLETIKESQGLEEIKISNISPSWDCPELQRLRKQDKIPHFELTVLNGYTNNDFEQWIKSN